MTDRLRFGDDLFLLRGEVYFTGCLWILTTFFGLDTGIGTSPPSLPPSLFPRHILLTHKPLIRLPSLLPSLPPSFLPGLNLSQWGGLMVLTFCVVMINNFASLTAVVGQVRREEGREGGREWGGG